MRRKDVRRLICRFGDQRLVYHDFDDRYALDLLLWAVGDRRPVRELRRGPFAHLLAKPVVRELLAGCGDGVLRAEQVLAAWPQERERYRHYRVTLGEWANDEGRWGAYYQMARGPANLVLQLNLPCEHDREFRRQFGRLEQWDFHPVHGKGRTTVAWVRLDLEPSTGEALVEEIQSDWVREHDGRPDYRDGAMERYCHRWQDAALGAALAFLREELGVDTAWYFSHRTGNAVKGIVSENWDDPAPRSLYTRLPRRFGFERRREGPAWIEGLRRVKAIRRRLGDRWSWYRLEIPEVVHTGLRRASP